MRKLLPCWPLLLAPPALAAPVTVISTDTVHELAADGTWISEITTTQRVNEQIAVTGAGQARLQYSESLQELEILEAYTTTKDGQRVDVALDRIITQQLPMSSGAPMFSDYKVKNVVFPPVEVGATLTLRSRMKQLKPFMPGVFTMGTSYNRFIDFDRATLTVRAPADRALQVHGRNVAGGQSENIANGRREWRWTFGPTKGDIPEPGSLAPESISPGVLVSSFNNWAELADAYVKGAAPAARATPAVRTLAAEITAGKTTRRAQAEAIYRWVSREIRYVAIAMGTGGYVPHDADEVIAARYGDCKDKTALLIALLAAKDIVAVPALLNTGPFLELPEKPILSSFNHVIAYVPEFDLYLDGTIPMAPFDSPPAPLRGRPILIAAHGTTPAKVTETPRSDPAKDISTSTTIATITADGSVNGISHLDVRGAADGATRSALSLIPEQAKTQFARSLIGSAGRTGDGSITLADLNDFSQTRLLSLEFRHPGLISIPGPGSLPDGAGLYGSAGGKSFVRSVQQVERKLDFPCPSGNSADTLELTLAEGMKISRVPESATVESPFGKFSVSYEAKDGKLLMRQSLLLTQPKLICTAADHQQIKQFSSDIAGHLRRQVLYE